MILVGIDVTGNTPADPSGPVSWLDTMQNSAGSLGSGLASGFTGFIGGIANAIGSIFGGGGRPNEPPQPLDPIFNPIKTNLEAALGPRFDQIDQLLIDSAGLGDESKTIQQEMRDLLDPENPDSELWVLQDEINTLQDERNDLQDQMIELNRKNIEEASQYISRSIFIPRNQPVNDDFFEVVAHPSNGHRWRVKAKPGWTGHYVWQSTYYFDTGDASPVIDGRQVGFTRQWDEYAWNRTPSILTYWVKRDSYQYDDLKIDPYYTAQSVWQEAPNSSFTVKRTAKHDISFKVTWQNANRGSTYRHRILRNGEQLFIWASSNLGPMWPWESGVRTRTISEFGVDLNEGDVITFETYSSGSLESQRRVSPVERKIGWTIPAEEI